MRYDSNPDWYRAKYALAREYVTWANGKKSAGKAFSLLDRAEACVSELLDQAETTLTRPVWGWSKKTVATKKLKQFIARDVVPAAQVLRGEIKAARETREAEPADGVTPATVEGISEQVSDNPDVSYALARFYAQVEAPRLARESLQLVVEGTGRSAWPGLAHKFARDPILVKLVKQPGFEPVEGFDRCLRTALSAAEGKVETS